MSDLKYRWKYGENEHQKYYDVYIGKDHLCVWQNKWEPDIWMGMSRDKMIHNKTKNNKYRRKEKLPLNTHWSELRCDTILCSIDPVYMMKKVEYCYCHNIDEISE